MILLLFSSLAASEDCHLGGSLPWDKSGCNKITCGGEDCGQCGPWLPQKAVVGKCWYDKWSQQDPCSCCKKIWFNQTSCDDPCSPDAFDTPGPTESVCRALAPCFWGRDAAKNNTNRCCLAWGASQTSCTNPCTGLSRTQCAAASGPCFWDDVPGYNECRCTDGRFCGPRQASIGETDFAVEDV